ncbi:hypothetical protein OAK22_01730 [Nitrosopumilus sp.]|nr:hypothetical protein [Nitrosopumilus sp.]
MISQDNLSQMISQEHQDRMKNDSYRLIRELSKVEMDKYGRCKLFLHDSSKIEFYKLEKELIDRFLDIVKKYGKIFVHLIQNLKSESVIQRIETDHIIGGIDFQMTRSIRQSGNNNVVCISYTKNMFTPENLLLGAIILGIGSLADQFKGRRDEWDEPGTDNFRMSKLDKVSTFAHFLQKDRYVSKLIRDYYKNYHGIEMLLQKVMSRMNYGKIDQNYLKLVKFLQIWKYWDKILSDNDTLSISLRTFLDGLSEDKLYEYWLFYKIVESYGQIQKMKQKKKNIFENGKYEIEFQWTKKIGWRKLGGQDLNRRPDILIRKNKKDLAIIDAKYMSGNNLLEISGEGSMPSPQIVNQMIIAMDYGKEKTHVDLGIVLFADKDAYPVTIEKNDSNKKIHFRKMHPENDVELELEEMKKIIG